MNRLLLTFFISIFTSALSAQDIAASFLDKHGKDESLEVITIGKKMLEMMTELTAKDAELQEAIKGLESIRVVSAKDKNCGEKYYKTAYQLLQKNKDFEELLTARKAEEDTLIMIRENRGKVKELVLLAGKKEKFSLICIVGNIDLKTLTKYAGKLKIDGLDKLSSIEE